MHPFRGKESHVPNPGPALFALDEVMPRYDVSEVRETWVSAPPGPLSLRSPS